VSARFPAQSWKALITIDWTTERRASWSIEAFRMVTCVIENSGYDMDMKNSKVATT